MKQITQESCLAFLHNRDLRKSNMVSEKVNTVQVLKLFGNIIAHKDIDNEVLISFAGWTSPTTKERLNGLAELMELGRPFYVKQGVLYCNNQEICPSADYYIKSLVNGSK